ncbi:hypothetical protein, partial [Streptomyces albus]|uniref:hypothetical protein n=1 Tax=Streptomyces albus TaxID=1888 RepID=UPI00196A0E4C
MSHLVGENGVAFGRIMLRLSDGTLADQVPLLDVRLQVDPAHVPMEVMLGLALLGLRQHLFVQWHYVNGESIAEQRCRHGLVAQHPYHQPDRLAPRGDRLVYSRLDLHHESRCGFGVVIDRQLGPQLLEQFRLVNQRIQVPAGR